MSTSRPKSATNRIYSEEPLKNVLGKIKETGRSEGLDYVEKNCSLPRVSIKVEKTSQFIELARRKMKGMFFQKRPRKPKTEILQEISHRKYQRRHSSRHEHL